MLKIEMEYDQGVLFVRMKGTLDRKNTYKINNYLNPVIKKHNMKYLIYNFENLENIDEAGIDALKISKCFIKRNKGKVRICGINENIKGCIKSLKIPTLKKEQEVYKIMEMI